MIYKRIGHWHLDVTIHGVRYREALNTTDKRQTFPSGRCNSSRNASGRS